MSWFAAVLPPRNGPPDTTAELDSFRIRTAAIVRPAAPVKADPSVVMVTTPEGEIVAYAPSEKLVILAERRAKRASR